MEEGLPIHADYASAPSHKFCVLNRQNEILLKRPYFTRLSMTGKSETRISKSETNSNDRNSNPKNTIQFRLFSVFVLIYDIRISILFRILGFDIRIYYLIFRMLLCILTCQNNIHNF